MKDSTTPLTAPAGEPEMPALPEPDIEDDYGNDGWSAAQVRAYAKAYGDARAEHARRVALESVKFHRQASHISPDFRDCFNATIDQAIRAAAPPQGEKT